MTKATTKIVLVKIAKVSGKYPVKLRVTFNRKQKFYPCNIDLSEDEFIQVFQNPKLKKKEKENKDIAIGIEAKAVGIINALKKFNFDAFENKFYEKTSGDGDVYDLFTRVHGELIAADRIGSAIMYNTVTNSLKSYRTKLTFEEVTTMFLTGYETWLQSNTNQEGKDNSKSTTSVGIYMRHLRSIYNKGISENLAAKENYPFGRNKYVIPTGNNIKKALTVEEVGKIFKYQTTKTGWEAKAKDLWCFSYLANGMNVMDVAKLKYKDIYNGEIHYERSKTIRTNRGKNTTLISIPILPQTERIIDKWGNPDRRDDNYIFPIISPGLSAFEIKKHVQQFTKNMNKYTKRIAISLGIERNLTTYVARHSFATVLKRSGATIEAISENLGHKSIGTTRSYLSSFETESRMKTAQALIAFDVDK